MNKESSGLKNLAAQVAVLAAGGALSTAIWGGIEKAKEKYDLTQNMNRHWNQLRKRFPEELAGEGEGINKENFESIYRLAPSIAKVPGLSIHFLRLAKEYSTGGMDPTTIATLAKAEDSIQSAKMKRTNPIKLFGLDKKMVAEAVDGGFVPTLPIGNPLGL